MVTVQTSWNQFYHDKGETKPIYDLWLDKYSESLSRSVDTPILDLGCGPGNNSLYLIERGYQVISCDYSEEALQIVRKHVPEAVTLEFDMLDGIPLADGSAKIVVADLCLHYFSWKDTEKIVADIRRILTDDGALFCRLNSVNDTANGAGQGTEIENNYYFVNDKYKRFFDIDQISALFKDWSITYCNEYVSERHRWRPKYHWEIALKKS